MEAAGIEPDAKSAAPTETVISYVMAPFNCAANALHRCTSECRLLSGLDSDLQIVVAAWHARPEFVRKTVLSLVTQPI